MGRRERTAPEADDVGVGSVYPRQYRRDSTRRNSLSVFAVRSVRGDSRKLRQLAREIGTSIFLGNQHLSPTTFRRLPCARARACVCVCACARVCVCTSPWSPSQRAGSCTCSCLNLITGNGSRKKSEKQNERANGRTLRIVNYS